MCLDVSTNPNDYNNLIIYQYNKNANQKFYIKAGGNGKFGIFTYNHRTI